MRRFGMAALIASIVAIAAIGAPTVAGQAQRLNLPLGVKAAGWNPPRLTNGRPNLGGHWAAPAASGSIQIEKVTDEEFQKAGGVAAQERSFGFYRVYHGNISDPPDGKIPYQPWALAKRQGYLDRQNGDDPYGHCRIPGVPRQMYVFGNRLLVQSIDYMAIINEESGDRVVPLHPRPHLGKDIKLWMGDSLGRWDGDVLVIETTNQNGRTWHSVPGDFTSENLHVVERLEMVDDDTINYSATISDPTIYTRPWTMSMPWKRLKPGMPHIFGGVVPPGGYEFILEWACREGDWNPETRSPNSGHDSTGAQ